MDRRSFVASLCLSPFFVSSLRAVQDNAKIIPKAAQGAIVSEEQPDETRRIAQGLFDMADEQGWKSLGIGEIMAKAGARFVGTPYVGGTLEKGATEQCTIDLKGLDCVTFFENMLAFARCVKKGTHGLDSMLEEVEWTRYRDGKCDGYTSRLHYTGDWILNNVAKDVVLNVTEKLGGVSFPLHVDFMSKNPKYYKPLQSNPALIAVIAEQERTLSARRHWYIPVDKIEGIESKLRSGDIIAIATSKPGLDYSHTGMISKSDDGVARFLHASLAKKQVVLDTAISAYVRSVKTNIGISVLRPCDVSARR